MNSNNETSVEKKVSTQQQDSGLCRRQHKYSQGQKHKLENSSSDMGQTKMTTTVEKENKPVVNKDRCSVDN